MQMGIIAVAKLGSWSSKDLGDSPAACLIDVFGSFALQPPPAARGSLSHNQPRLSLDRQSGTGDDPKREETKRASARLNPERDPCPTGCLRLSIGTASPDI